MNQIQDIVIVGGGTAGWLTAGVLAAEVKNKYAESPVTITLIESPTIAPVGVGEGTWPTMRKTLERIGISEIEFIKACDVSFKQGSKFCQWNHDKSLNTYYHPFSLPEAFSHINLAWHWMRKNYDINFSELVSPQQVVCEHFLAPKQLSAPEYAYTCNYGYHFDASSFAEFLKEHCLKKLNVNFIQDDVVSVKTDQETDDITQIITSKNDNISGDLFVDCTGRSALLIGKHFQIPFISRKDCLFIDSALAVQIPYEKENSPIASTTKSTAQEAGWIWDIGLFSRRGVGYAYASDYITEEEAEKQLYQYIQDNSQSVINDDELLIKKISFEPGYRQQLWKNNCVAIGLSAGFVEPLEASSLALVEISATMLAEQLPKTRDVMDIISCRFNERMLHHWQSTVDFLKLHYVLSKRSKDQFWLDNRDPKTVSKSLSTLLSLWQSQVPWYQDFDRMQVFPAASYQYVLTGMGYKTQLLEAPSLAQESLAVEQFNTVQKNTGMFLANLPTNRELLANIRHHYFSAN